MSRFPVGGRRLFAVGILAAQVGSGATGCEAREPQAVKEQELPGFSGRSAATKSALVVVACGGPDAPEVAPPPREVNSAQPLRRLADPWSGDRPKRSAKEVAGLLEQVPPKYRQAVKDYFEQLEKK